MAAPDRLRALIFDFDGTLADTLPICIGAFQGALRQHTGRRMGAAEVTALFGPNEEGMLREILPDAFEPAMATFLYEYERLHASCTAPFDGLAELLDRLAERKLQLGVVTGKGAHSAAISLRAVGLAGRFDGIETGSPLGSIKPEAIRRLLAEWQIPAPASAYVGDSPMDVRAARETGAITVAAAWAPGTDPEPLAAEQPDFLFQSVEAFAAWAIRITG